MITAPTEATAAARAIRVLVCRVGQVPTVELLQPDERGSHLAAMQQIVGGNVELVRLESGLDLWCNEGAIGLELPLNVSIPTRAPEARDGFELLPVGSDLARPGEHGQWRIHGDYFLARNRGDDIADVTDDDIVAWTAAWLRRRLRLLRRDKLTVKDIEALHALGVTLVFLQNADAPALTADHH